MYDFDEPVERRGTSCAKWDTAYEGELPMWVADMDFRTAPEVLDAVVARAQHGVYGYEQPSPEYGAAIAAWWGRRHGVDLNPEHVMYCTSVVAALSSAIRSLTAVGEKVVLQPPVYNCFFRTIRENGRSVLESPLVYEGGCYRMDFDDLEQKLADPQATLFLLCNPHNPSGNLWTRDDLAKVGELCAKHGVKVVSDEIHCELTRPGMRHVPFASVNETCRDISVTCSSPSKAFNLAGLQSSYLFAHNDDLRACVERGLHADELALGSVFAYCSTIAAYEGGEAWLDELRAYLQANKDLVETYVAEHIPGIRVVASDATYLMWLDCSALTADADDLQEYLRGEGGLYLNKGSAYGEAGRAFLRLNVGTQRANVEEGLKRLEAGCKAYAQRQ